MSRRSVTIAVLGLAAGGLMPLPSAAAATTASVPRLSSFDTRLLADINHARRIHHLHPVAAKPGTTDVARGWSCALARASRLSHRPHLPYAIEHHGSPNWTALAENVGRTSHGADVLFRSYMNSRDHRANILNPRVTVVGIHTKRVSSGAWNVLDFVNNYYNSYGATRTSC